MSLRFGLPLVAFLALARAAPSSSAETDPLAALAGAPAIVEFPDLAHLGQRLEVPEGWGYLHVRAETYATLAPRLGVSSVPALVFLDRFGNRLHMDVGSGCRERWKAGALEFERRRKELEERIAKLAAEARSARDQGKEGRELARLVELGRLPWRGYREVVLARARCNELDGARWGDLLRLLAREGLEPPSRLREALEDLAIRAKGLPVARRIRAELERLERGEVVESRP